MRTPDPVPSSEDLRSLPVPNDVCREPALQVTVFDAETKTRGFIVANRLVGGRAMGGTRIATNVTLEEVRALARRMTLKLALAGVDIGGAKAGIELPTGLSPEERREALRRFAHLARSVLHGGVYIGTDLGCTYEDRQFIHDCAGYSVEKQVPSLPFTWDELWRHCRDVTGLGVAHAAAAAVGLVHLEPATTRVSVQGFGEVGQAAARWAQELGLLVVAVADRHGMVHSAAGLPLAELAAITDPYGSIDRTRLPRGVTAGEGDAWLDVDAEILILAAVANAVNESNVKRVRARIVVEGANEPTSPAAVEILTKRGVCVVPDIIANAGGAIACGLSLRGELPARLNPIEASEWLFRETAKRVRANVRAAYDAAGGVRSLHPIADAQAETEVSAMMERSPASAN
jgi:glutamate dehydrogenase (NAD(P)+)